MKIFILNRIRKLFKSIGKREKIIDDLITFEHFKKASSKFKLSKNIFKPQKEFKKPIKLVAVIAFYFKKNKIKNLIRVCKSLEEISKNNEIHIITNHFPSSFKKEFKKKLKISINFIVIKETINDRLLPWYHHNLFRRLYKNKKITHFAYLEDDILLTKENFNYWVNSRELLKKFNFIPAFVRTETNLKNKEIYAIDFLKKNRIKEIPKININDNYDFLNHKYPYQGMYLYDRKLIKEYLFGPSSNPDCGHGAFNEKYINKKMIYFDLLAKANIGLIYIDVPKGFFSRAFLVYNKKDNMVDNSCCIKHLSEKYSNIKSPFGNIKLEEAIK